MFEYSSTHSSPRQEMEVSGQLHAPAALPRGEGLFLVGTEYEVGWTSETVWTFWTRKKSLTSVGEFWIFNLEAWQFRCIYV